MSVCVYKLIYVCMYVKVSVFVLLQQLGVLCVSKRCYDSILVNVVVIVDIAVTAFVFALLCTGK